MEALGIAFLEASASGLPTLVGRSGGAPETVLDGESGFVVDPREPDDVAAALCRLLADPDLARSMGAVGREFVTREYGLDATAAAFRELVALTQSSEARRRGG